MARLRLQAAANAILDLKVCDPAVGSGHFLIAAAHRMARRLASVRTGDDEPSPKATREALRDVIGRCLYGVDVNPMAAELCKVSLWMEALVPGRPLSFLDNHIRVGNSLLGATPELISDGIPNDAFKPIEGDDKKLTNAYRKRNREERAAWESGQFSFFLGTLDRNLKVIERGYEQIEEGEEGSVVAVREKAARYAALQESKEMFHARRLADAWCAAFVWPKREGAPDPITQQVFAELTQGAHAVSGETEKEIERIVKRYNFFYWHLAFPNVFGYKGGFDVVLGNPPWEQLQFDPQEFFAASAPAIAEAQTTNARNQLIKALATEDPGLYAAYREGVRELGGIKHFIHFSGRYPLTSYGRLNSAPLFAELCRSVVAPTGRVGLVVPTGIATDSFNQYFFGDLISTRTLASLYDFVNNAGLFPGVGHGRTKFCLLTMTGIERPYPEPEFAFFASYVADLADDGRRFTLSAEDIALLNPNTRTCPIFRTHRDAEITTAIYRRVPVLVDENKKDGNPWGFSGLLMFMMNTDSGLFRTHEELATDGWELEGNYFIKQGKRYLPLYEAKMFHQFDHRYGDYSLRPEGSQDTELPRTPVALMQDPSHVVMPRYWVPERETEERLQNRWRRGWLLGWRDITNATSERTVIASILPRVGCGNQTPLMFIDDVNSKEVSALIANLSAFAYDYPSRQKTGGSHLNFYIYQQLPVLSPDTYSESAPWEKSIILRDWLSPRVLELTYTAWDLQPFAADAGFDGPPFRWNPERRFLLRCELDAAFFHLYGIERDDVDYIMETFHLVKRKDEAIHGEYRTKRVILEIYDQMAQAAETNQPYRTPLDPPPADLALPASQPACTTVTPLCPRTQHQPEVPAVDRVAEQRSAYQSQPSARPSPELEEQANGAAEATPAEEAPSARGPLLRKHSTEPQDALFERPAPEALTLDEAALALHTCVPDGEKVERHTLLLNTARELGQAKLTKKVRRILNQAINAENNAGRLRTDWERVWKPRRK